MARVARPWSTARGNRRSSFRAWSRGLLTVGIAIGRGSRADARRSKADTGYGREIGLAVGTRQGRPELTHALANVLDRTGQGAWSSLILSTDRRNSGARWAIESSTEANKSAKQGICSLSVTIDAPVAGLAFLVPHQLTGHDGRVLASGGFVRQFGSVLIQHCPAAVQDAEIIPRHVFCPSHGAF